MIIYVMQMFLGHVLVSQQKPVNDDRKLNSGQNATPGEALEALLLSSK